MDASLRVWAQDQLDQGKVTVVELQRAGCEEGGQSAGASPPLVETPPRGSDERARCHEARLARQSKQLSLCGRQAHEETRHR